MGKAEQYKFERKLVAQQIKAQTMNKQERNKLFISGAIAGLVVGLFLGWIMFHGSKSQTADQDLKISTNSATINPNVAVPSNLQISLPSETPKGIGQ